MSRVTADSDLPASFVHRPLSGADAASLIALSDEAGWNQTVSDWRLMLGLGGGFGIFATDGTAIASALVVPYGSDFAWISMVLVSARWRRRGIATRLVLQCLECLTRWRRKAVLDATSLGQPTYRPLGFREMWTFTRMRANSEALDFAPLPTGMAEIVAPMSESHLAQAVAVDGLAFGAPRRRVIADFCRRRPAQAMVATRDGKVVALACARDGRRAMHIGPLIAESAPVAQALMREAAARCDGSVVIDVCDQQTVLHTDLAGAGFEPVRQFARMTNSDLVPGRPELTFAVAGPEFG